MRNFTLISSDSVAIPCFSDVIRYTVNDDSVSMSTPEVMNVQHDVICTKRPSLVTRTTTFVLLLMFLFSLPTKVHGMVSDGSVASGSNINGFPLH